MTNQQLTVDVFNNGVAQLSASSRDLAARFGQQRTVEGQVALIREELAEVLAATDDAHRVEELCDLIVVASGLIASAHALYGTYEYPIELDSNVSNSICLYDLGNWVQLMITMGKTTPFVSGQTIIIHIYRYLQSIPNAAELFRQQVAAVVAKNAAKTTDTHYLNTVTGKITRKAAMPEPEDNINADLENGAAVDGWLDGGV